MDLSEQDRARISAVIRAKEARTSGEIICVLAKSSSDQATAVPVLIAAAVVAAFPVGVTRATEVSGADVIPRAALADATMLSMHELALSGTGIGTNITPFSLRVAPADPQAERSTPAA